MNDNDYNDILQRIIKDNPDTDINVIRNTLDQAIYEVEYSISHGIRSKHMHDGDIS